MRHTYVVRRLPCGAPPDRRGGPVARRPALCAIVNSRWIVPSVRFLDRWNAVSVSEGDAQVRPIDNPDELLCTAHRVIKGLVTMALSARCLRSCSRSTNC